MLLKVFVNEWTNAMEYKVVRLVKECMNYQMSWRNVPEKIVYSLTFVRGFCFRHLNSHFTWVLNATFYSDPACNLLWSIAIKKISM